MLAYVPSTEQSSSLLPAPQNVTILSTNMKHFLLWSPVSVPGEAVKYSVEFQGEYERNYTNDTWIPIGKCTGISVTQCDITEDVSATVPYNLRVRAALGTQASHWASLDSFFNRITTSLTPPTLTVSAAGYHLLVELEHLGPAFEFWIYYWRKDQKDKVYCKMVRNSSMTIHLEKMEPSAEYCIRAQTYVEAINRSSNFSEVQCVKAEGKSNTGLDGALYSTILLMNSAEFIPVWLPFLKLVPKCGSHLRGQKLCSLSLSQSKNIQKFTENAGAGGHLNSIIPDICDPLIAI
uniref:Interleukin 20 receptor subunit beta n=1 Tax=Varanus komodoensis TaxID=61221 RepID=A0A8D2KQY2_VARKO